MKLLIVEDNPDDARLIELQVRKLDPDVMMQRVETAADLERLLGAECWDAVISDYSLPGFSGFEALRIVRQADANVPFILISGTVGEEQAVEAMRRGAHDYLMKSSLARLVPALQRELQDARVRRERAAAADDLRRSEERFRALIENGSDIISVMSRAGRNIYVSPSVQRVLGYTPEEMLEVDPFELIHPDDRSLIAATFAQEIERTGSTATHEYRSRHKDGSWRWLESIGRNLLDDPAVGAVVVTSRDTTERKLLHEQLAQSERLSGLGRLSATVAHEFNNVLMGIQPFCEIIRRLAPDQPQIARATASIAGSIARGSRITQDILRFTQPAVPSAVPLDARSWLENSVNDLQHMLGERHQVTLTLPEENLTLFADAQQLTQVVTNIVLNARDAMPNGGAVRLSARRLHGARVFPFGVIADDKQYIHLQIADDGAGMPRELIARIFEPLFTTKKNGTGLGLAVADQIVRKHGGHMLVESHPGLGTSFHIFIPAATHMVAAQPSTRGRLPAADTGLCVLLVEDDANVASGIAELLETLEYRVTTAREGSTAIAASSAKSFDVVVLDVNLPDMSGLEVFAALRRERPELPVVFSTGHCDASTLASVVGNPPGVAFLLKPYPATELVGSINDVIASMAAYAAAG